MWRSGKDSDVATIVFIHYYCSEKKITEGIVLSCVCDFVLFFSVCYHNNSRKAQPNPNQIFTHDFWLEQLSQVRKWASQVTWSSRQLWKTSWNEHYKSHGLAAILEKHPKHLFSHSPMHPHPPLPGAVCKCCTLDNFIIWDMALSLRAGQSQEGSCYYCCCYYFHYLIIIIIKIIVVIIIIFVFFYSITAITSW